MSRGRQRGMHGKELMGRRKRIMRIHCFSGKQLSGVRCFVMRDVGAATAPEPVEAGRASCLSANSAQGLNDPPQLREQSRASAPSPVGAMGLCRAWPSRHRQRGVPVPMGAPGTASHTALALGQWRSRVSVPCPTQCPEPASLGWLVLAPHGGIPSSAGKGRARAVLLAEQ